MADKAVSQISVGSGSRHVAMTDDGSYAFVANEMSGTTSVIRTSDRTNLANVATGVGSWFPIVLPNSSYCYVVKNAASGGLSKVRTSDQTLITTIATGSHPQYGAVTADGSFIYVANVNSGTVSVVNTDTDTVAATISLGATTRPLFVAINPNGSFAYVTRNTNPGYVSVINTSSNAAIATVTVGSNPVFVAVRPF